MTTTILVRPLEDGEPIQVSDADSDGMIAVHRGFEQPFAGPDDFAWVVTHVPSGCAFHRISMRKAMADDLAAELRALPRRDDWQFTDLPVPLSFASQTKAIAFRYKAAAEQAQVDAALEELEAQQ